MRVIYLFVCVFFIFRRFSSRAWDTHEDINQILLNYFEIWSWEHTPSSAYPDGKATDVFGLGPPGLQMTFQLFFLIVELNSRHLKRWGEKATCPTLTSPSVRLQSGLMEPLNCFGWRLLLFSALPFCTGFTSQPLIMSRQYASAGKHVHATSGDIQYTEELTHHARSLTPGAFLHSQVLNLKQTGLASCPSCDLTTNTPLWLEAIKPCGTVVQYVKAPPVQRNSLNWTFPV